MGPEVFLAGYVIGALTVLAWLAARRAWRRSFGEPADPPVSDQQKANQRYYEALRGSRGAWRAARFTRQIQRGNRQ